MSEIILTLELFILLLIVLIFLYNFYFRIGVYRDQEHFGIILGRRVSWLMRINIIIPIISAVIIASLIIESLFL